MNFIGKKLDEVINYFENNNIKYIIKDNNFSVQGDTKLVTNVISNDKGVIIYTGDFIFDVRNKKSEK